MSREKHVAPFVKATTDVLKLQAGMDFQTLAESRGEKNPRGPEVNVIIGLTGKLSGSISISMSEETATQIASAMANSLLTDKKEIGSIITALGSAITSEASMELSKMGFECAAPFPTVVMGTELMVATPIREDEKIYLHSSIGQIGLRGSFMERKTSALS